MFQKEYSHFKEQIEVLITIARKFRVTLDPGQFCCERSEQIVDRVAYDHVVVNGQQKVGYVDSHTDAFEYFHHFPSSYGT